MGTYKLCDDCGQDITREPDHVCVPYLSAEHLKDERDSYREELRLMTMKYESACRGVSRNADKGLRFYRELQDLRALARALLAKMPEVCGNCEHDINHSISEELRALAAAVALEAKE